MSRDRQFRGRLSSIDRLPPAADGDVMWAIDEVRAGRLTQTEISAELNRRLAARGLQPVPRATFSRWVTAGMTSGFPARFLGRSADALHCPRCGAGLALALRASS